MKHIRELDGLRGLMALWVVLGHSLTALPALFGPFPNSLHNYVPVQVFIILSGFVIFSLIDATYENYKRYILGRFLRIFPVYLTVLLVSTLSLGFSASALRNSPSAVGTEARLHVIDAARENLLAHVIAHLPLLQGLVPTRLLPDATYTLVGQAWSLSVEWQFYLLAPALFLIARSLRKPWAGGVAVLGVALCGVLSPSVFNDGFIGANLQMFMVGFVSYFALQYGLLESMKSLRPVASTILLLALVFSPQHMAALTIWLICLFNIVSMRRDGRQTRVCAILSSKAAAYLGGISYPLYLFHMQALFVCLWAVNGLGLSSEWRLIVLPVAVIATSILGADIVHRAIETPFHELGRRLSIKRSTGAARAHFPPPIREAGA